MDFPSGHHPFASGQHHFASGENNCKKFFAIPQYPHPYIIFWQIKTPDFIFQLLSIISHPFGFILQQTPIQNYKSTFLMVVHRDFANFSSQTVVQLHPLLKTFESVSLNQNLYLKVL